MRYLVLKFSQISTRVFKKTIIFWLIGSEVYSVVTLTHFRKTSSMAIVTTRESAVVTIMGTSLAINEALATPQLLQVIKQLYIWLFHAAYV